MVMRHGENARAVIERVKARLKEAEPSLPKGVRIVTTYDRSELIERSLENLKHELTLEILIVCLVILVFLWHIPSAIVPIITIPVAVLLAFIPMSFLGISSNIMSLAGHRDLHRRARRRRHRRGGERLQEARAVAVGRAPGRLPRRTPRSAPRGRARRSSSPCS